MLLTASKMAACRMAKLRVEWMVGDWAPGVRTIVRRVLFHSMTALTDCAAEGPSSSPLSAKPVDGIKRTAHTSMSVEHRFAMEVSLGLNSVNFQNGAEHRCS